MNIGKTHLTQLQFERLWNSIYIELSLLYNGKKCSASIIYNNIYIICTSPSHKFVEDLYWKVGDFLYEILRSSKHKIFDKKNWITEYTILYQKYLSFIKSIDDLGDYLNQYITSKSIYHFGFLLWERCILQGCYKYKKVNFGEYIVFHNNLEEVKICIESLRNINVEPTKPLLYYTERYEKYALSYVIDNCTSFIDNNKNLEIIDYVKKVSKFIKNERLKRINLFLQESWDKLDMILEDILIIQKKKWIKNEIYKILIQHKLPVDVLNTIINSMTENKKCTISLFDNFNNKLIVDNKINIDQINGNAPQFKSNRNTNKVPNHPLNDFYALFSNDIPNLYTFTTCPLKEVRNITKNFSILRYSYDVLENVLQKYLTSQLLSYNHLLNKNIETLYIFYTLFKHVIKVGFNDIKRYNDIFIKKVKEVYNSLSPSLSNRLIKFSNIVVLGDCVLEKQKIDIKKGYIDFYSKSDICSLNEEEGIDYWGSTPKTKIRIKSSSNYFNEEDINEIFHKEEIPISFEKDIQYLNRNISLPDISRLPSFSYKDGAFLRVFVHLYNLIDDKVDFYKKYIIELSRRILLSDINYYKELEVFSLLKCDDRDIKLRGEIMFNDIKSFLSDKSGIHLLTESAWPIEVENINFKIPNFINKEINKVNKKRVQWAWEYSLVIVEIDDKEFRFNFLQFLIINLFNKYNVLDNNLIKKELEIEDEVLDDYIKSLIKSKMIILDKNKYLLNRKSNITNVVEYFTKEEINKTSVFNKEVYYLCKIANLLKKYKCLKEKEIIEILCDEHTDRFSFSIEDYKSSLSSVIEKGIIENNNEVYKYIP